jgi:ribosomal protein L4
MVTMGYSVDVYNTEGKVVSKVDLNADLFSDEKINKTLIQEYLLLQQANGRIAIADTKDRSEVS